MSSLQKAILVLVFVFGPVQTMVGQNENDERINKQLEFYHDAILNQQNLDVSSIGDPDTDQFIDIAEHAVSKLYTADGKSSELRSLARKLDDVLTDLSGNEVGKWIGTNEQTVRIFIGFDIDAPVISDRGIAKRVNRLRASVKSLKGFNATQGKFDPSSSAAVRAILIDADWVNKMHQKISSRLAAVEKMVKNFPQGQNFDASPTLAKAKSNFIAAQVIQTEKRKATTRQVAHEKGLSNDIKAKADREIAESTRKIEEEDLLAEFNRRLMIAEYELKRAEIESKIDTIRVTTINNNAVAAKKKLVTYLKSPRVKELLAPFVTPDLVKFGAHHEMYKIDSLDPQPASLSQIASLGNPRTLDPSQKGMINFVFYVNVNATKRPKWPIHHQKWQDAGETFENMSGDKVNPYREAQRILREHGQTLVELGMLVK